MKKKTIFYVIIETFKQWNQDNVSHLAAALSYYTLFSLAPVLIICIAIAGSVMGEATVTGRVIEQISGVLGHDSALEIKTLMDNIRKPSTNILASILGGLTFIWGSLGLFSELQHCFNVVWQVKPKPGRTWWNILKSRSFSFVLVLGVSFLLLLSLLFSAFLKVITDRVYDYMPFASNVSLILDFLISIGGTTILFALVFKIIPDVILKWRNVLLGAFVTALLFTLGKFILSAYLAKSHIATSFGAAASLIVILIWVYYSAQIVLFGAEFTKVYTHAFGSHEKIKKMAEHL